MGRSAYLHSSMPNAVSGPSNALKSSYNLNRVVIVKPNTNLSMNLLRTFTTSGSNYRNAYIYNPDFSGYYLSLKNIH